MRDDLSWVCPCGPCHNTSQSDEHQRNKSSLQQNSTFYLIISFATQRIPVRYQNAQSDFPIPVPTIIARTSALGPQGQPFNSKRAHFRPWRFKHHQNSTRRHPERHRKSEMVAGEGNFDYGLSSSAFSAQNIVVFVDTFEPICCAIPRSQSESL